MKGPFGKLLVLINGSEASVSAAKYAVALARAYRSELVAVYVVDTASLRQLVLSRIFVPDESAEYEERLEESGVRLLNYAKDIAKSAGFPMETKMLKGAIAGEVIKAADECKADCILLGGWDRGSTLRDVLMDSYREIMRSASCPVLVVRGAKAEEACRGL
jgi:nucleotide-binding universal stress UspA family protein